MRLLLLLSFITFVTATDLTQNCSIDEYFGSSLVGNRVEIFQSDDGSQAILAAVINDLAPEPKPFKVDYGTGIITAYLEELTISLLNYDIVANIVHTLTDDIDSGTPEKRARILVNTGSKSVNFRLLF